MAAPPERESTIPVSQPAIGRGFRRLGRLGEVIAERRFERAAAWTGAAAASALAVFYLAQQMTLAPNHADEAIVLELIRLVADGKRVHFDFIDVYGPLHHVGPALFWKLAGNKIWGVRIWILLVKLASLWLTFSIVRRVADRSSAWLAVAFMTVLLGLPWQALQIPFAFLNALPLLLGAYFLLICRPFGRPAIDFGLAGLLTAALAFVKVNVGAFLLAGGALYTLHWLPAPGSASGRTTVHESWFRRAQLVALTTYAVVFLLFAKHDVDPLFYFYFDVPLLLGLVVSSIQVRDDATAQAPFAHHVRATSIFAGSSLGFAALFLVGYFGVGSGIAYVKELVTLFRHVKYTHPVLPLGEPGFYYGFIEYYWMQFPWLHAALFVALWLLARNGRGEKAFPSSWPLVRARIYGLWMLATLGTFALVAHGTEVHLLAVLLPAGPSFFVLLFGVRRLVESALERRAPRAASWLPAGVLCVLVPLWLSTLVYVPRLDNLNWSRGDYTVHAGRPSGDNRLARLRFRQPGHPGFRDFSPVLSDHDWDAAVNSAAMFIDEIAEDDEEVLVLLPTQLITFHSFTSDIGGRYQYLFYLVRNGLLDREGFDALVPGDFVKRLVRQPPRIVVTSPGELARILHVIPELQSAGKRYRFAARFESILVLRRNDDGVTRTSGQADGRP